MDTNFNLWLSVIVISVVGTLAHFLYDWTGKNRIIGLFAAVNESTWEHIKIALTPTFLWSLYDGYLYGENPSYWSAKFSSLLVLVLFIPLAFKLYLKIFKKDILAFDIIIFYAAIILSQLIFYSLLAIDKIALSYFGCIGTFILFGCYMTLTLEPIKNELFLDPITNRYGFRAHSNPFKRKKKK